MPKCTKCNREITSLENRVTGLLVFHVNLDKQGDIQYASEDFEPDSNIAEYLCPECNEVLFTSDSEAITFLKGE